MLGGIGYYIIYETLTHHIHFITYFSQLSKSIDFKDLVPRDGLLYEKFTNEPFTGNLTGISQGKVKDGKIEGEWLDYYENGVLKSKENYKDGKLDGEYLDVDRN